MKILVVEDTEKLAEALKIDLSNNGYAVDVIGNGKQAFDRIILNHIDYDLIILDLMLPDMNGEEIISGMRERNITTPILVLTAKHETDTKVELLLSGADDYLTKPFWFEELCARIQAILRRPSNNIPAVLIVKNIELDSSAKIVRINGNEITLTLKEFMMLEYFMRNPNKVVEREELLSHLWEFDYNSFSNIVDVHVKNLRKKLGTKEPQEILETVWGVGYKLKG